jgi:uncharacterized protein YceH (UPF0502 family)
MMLNLWSFFAIFIIAEILITAESTEIISVLNEANFKYENPTCNQQYGDIKLSPKCIAQTCARHVTGTSADMNHRISFSRITVSNDCTIE